ncbi:BRCT domain-containing protein [Photobacterium damselae]|uniref:BRCT domain-containing protein n=1 Tax=Photobacterium damselae TaxID=38293 RepID=UPI004067F5FB
MDKMLSLPVEELSTPQLVEVLCYLNAEYRKGTTIISDDDFDFKYLEELKKRDPNHSFLTTPQPTSFDTNETGKVIHKTPMLSTSKVYTPKELEKWVQRVEKAAATMSINPASIAYRCTAKLDGIAGKLLDRNTLVTRGNDGIHGNNVTEQFISNGLKFCGEPQQEAVGEIVLDQKYFDENLSKFFKDSRNAVAGVANSDIVNDHMLKAMKDGAVHYVIYKDMDAITVNRDELIENISVIESDIRDNCAYQTDGIVIEITNEQLKAAMGSNSHDHNWQTAKKTRGVTVNPTVTEVVLQVGRSGAVTPVANFEPIKLGNVMVSKATCHNIRTMLDLGVGVGAVLELERAGDVIPNIVAVKERVEVEEPTICPCCNSHLEWDIPAKLKEDELPSSKSCRNPSCSAQAVNTICNHFKTLKVLGFGLKRVEALVEAGYTTMKQFYSLTSEDIAEVGLGIGNAANMISAINETKSHAVTDIVLLASVGIADIAKGQAKKLLAHYSLKDIVENGVTFDQLIAIDGFGGVLSKSCSELLNLQRENIAFLLETYTNISTSKKDLNAITADSAISGKNIVFTGTMEHGSRDDMSTQAEDLGANVQKKVNGKTDFLVYGVKAGDKKLEAAKAAGINVIPESEYLMMIA